MAIASLRFASHRYCNYTYVRTYHYLVVQYRDIEKPENKERDKIIILAELNPNDAVKVTKHKTCIWQYPIVIFPVFDNRAKVSCVKLAKFGGVKFYQTVN